MAQLDVVRLNRINEEGRLLAKLIEWGAIPNVRECCGHEMSLIYEAGRNYPRFQCNRTKIIYENGVRRKIRFVLT